MKRSGYTRLAAVALTALLISATTTNVVAQEYSTTEYSNDRYSTYEYDEAEYEVPRIDTRRWNNDLRVGIGLPGVIYLLATNIIVDVDAAPSDTHYTSSDLLASARSYDSDTRLLPPITLEYSRYINKWLMIGGKAMFSSVYYHERNIGTNKRVCSHYDNTYAMFVNIRFEYLRRDVVQLYSGIGVGATVRHDESYVVALPMIDVTYLGVTVGRNIYGFAELGGGISGCIRVGMGYKF